MPGEPSIQMGSYHEGFPTIHIVSDSLGFTAQSLARAAAGQFGVTDPAFEIFSRITDAETAGKVLLKHRAEQANNGINEPMVVFFSFVDAEESAKLKRICEKYHIYAVDMMTEPIAMLEKASGLTSSRQPGLFRQTDENYFRRIAAMEFTINHDDGRNYQDLPKADIVLLGVSRSSKTPISVYMGMEGYRVANVPLAVGTEPPAEVFECDPTRIFGLMTTPDVLVSIRQRRLGNAGKGATGAAGQYAQRDYVYDDLESARALMRKLGCIVIHTENKAVEETAQEILRYYELTHPARKPPVE